MEFVSTHDEAFWSYDDQRATALRRDGGLVFTLAPGSQTRGRWMPVVNALPEERVGGHPELLGDERYEVDVAYNDQVVLRTWPDADFSPEAFRGYAKERARRAARQTLADTDWMVIREMETGEPVPDEVRAARARVRAASDAETARVDRLSPTEWVEFSPGEVVSASREHRAAAKARR